MASRLYNVDASAARIVKLNEIIASQRIYVTTNSELERASAKIHLDSLEFILEIAKKTHAIIADVSSAIRQRNLDDSSFSDAGKP